MLIKPKYTPRGVFQLFTTRYSGKSLGDYSSFNLGYFTDDEGVKDNYKILKDVYKLQGIKILKQIHSAKIVVCENCDYSIEEGDGIFTSLDGFITGIQTADCWTVQLVGENYIANLHCGWRGLFLGIIENAYNLFSKYSDSVKYATVGPGICGDCYEVGSELIDKFSTISNADFYKKKNGRFFLNLEKIIVEKLHKFGTQNIEILSYCSFCKDYLYSYRRDNGKTGRMLSLLGKL